MKFLSYLGYAQLGFKRIKCNNKNVVKQHTTQVGKQTPVRI